MLFRLFWKMLAVVTQREALLLTHSPYIKSSLTALWPGVLPFHPNVDLRMVRSGSRANPEKTARSCVRWTPGMAKRMWVLIEGRTKKIAFWQWCWQTVCCPIIWKQPRILHNSQSLGTVGERSSVWGGIYVSTMLITRFTPRMKSIQKKKKKKGITWSDILMVKCLPEC